MSTSAIVMMILGCGIVWGGTVVAIVVAINGTTKMASGKWQVK